MNVMDAAGWAGRVTSPLTAGGKIAGNIGGESGKNGTATPFGQMFSDAISNVQNLEAIKNQDAYNLSIGDVDNLAELMVNAERSQTAFQMFVEMRNKVLDSYSEVMRMNV